MHFVLIMAAIIDSWQSDIQFDLDWDKLRQRRADAMALDYMLDDPLTEAVDVIGKHLIVSSGVGWHHDKHIDAKYTYLYQLHNDGFQLESPARKAFTANGCITILNHHRKHRLKKLIKKKIPGVWLAISHEADKIYSIPEATKLFKDLLKEVYI